MSMQTTLTPKQKQIVLLIRESELARGYPPTLQELGDRLGISKVTTHEHIAALQRKGIISKQKNKARSLMLNPQFSLSNESKARLPLVGSIAAGEPIEALESNEYLDLENLFLPSPSKNLFALKVTGESMIEDQIADGDFVICEKANQAPEGSIIVALINRYEATLKRYYLEPNHQIRLQPSNNNMSAMIYDANQISIQGKCVGVVRQFH